MQGTQLLISNAHLELSGTIKCMFQRCAWQRYRVHLRCKQLPNAVPIMDTARDDVLLIDSCATYLR
ncbi:MAG: hypothetical protein ACK59A_02520 [Cyanobacteriota bacterium]